MASEKFYFLEENMINHFRNTDTAELLFTVIEHKV